MEKILESLDESVFTEENKAKIQDAFDLAVDTKVIDKVAEIVESKVEALDEKFETFKEEYKTTLLENLDEFLDLIAEEYISENKLVIESTVKGEKLEALMEGFNAMLIAGGVELSEISENTSDVIESEELTEAKAKVDSLVSENKELKKEKAELIEMGLVAEAKEGLTAVQADKFDKLVDVISFDISEAKAFINKLDLIKESVTGSVGSVEADTVVESVNSPEILVEDYSDSKRFF